MSSLPLHRPQGHVGGGRNVLLRDVDGGVHAPRRGGGTQGNWARAAREEDEVVSRLALAMGVSRLATISGPAAQVEACPGCQINRSGYVDIADALLYRGRRKHGRRWAVAGGKRPDVPDKNLARISQLQNWKREKKREKREEGKDKKGNLQNKNRV